MPDVIMQQSHSMASSETWQTGPTTTQRDAPRRLSGAPRVPDIPTVVQVVARDIRKRVLDGEFEPGTQLRENDLLDDYQIARHGIRSALHALAHEGLLRHQPHRGVFVPEADAAEIADVLTVRFAIEAEAIRLIVEHDADTGSIVHALERLEAVPDDASWSELLAADFAVHQAIVDAVGSLRMSRIHDSLIGESALFLAFYGPKDQQRSVIRPLHRRLVESLLVGEVGHARDLLAADLQQGMAAANADG